MNLCSLVKLLVLEYETAAMEMKGSQSNGKTIHEVN